MRWRSAPPMSMPVQLDGQASGRLCWIHGAKNGPPERAILCSSVKVIVPEQALREPVQPGQELPDRLALRARSHPGRVWPDQPALQGQ